VKRLAALAVLAASPAFAAQPLRVCADPDNLPYSREDGSGFENRIAELVASDMKMPLQYEWLPDRRAFVRKTLAARKCDVIVGVPADFERTANTQPYYRSTHVIVERTGPGAAIRSLDDPRLATMRIGVQLIGNDMASSPPGAVLARHGYTTNVRGFPLAGDKPSAQRAIEALAHDEIDAAVLWGPQAGYFARHAGVPLRVTPLAALPGAHLRFAIAMGVRHSDTALRDRLDEFLKRRRPDIDRILAEYAVPIVAEHTP
jgi:mxaJ protein